MKCKACGRILDGKEYVEAKKGGKKVYYCPSHKDMPNKVKAVVEWSEKILGKVTYSLLGKSIKKSVEEYGYYKIADYLETQYDYLSKVFEQKTFSSEYGKMAYFRSILENNLPKYEEDIQPVVQKETTIGVPTGPKKVRKFSGKKSMNDILEGLNEH